MARNNRNKQGLRNRNRKDRFRKSKSTLKNKHKTQHRQQEILKAKAFITNISDYKLSDNEILALGYGLGYIPTPDKPRKKLIMQDCNVFIRNMRVRYIANINRWPKNHKFRLKFIMGTETYIMQQARRFFRKSQKRTSENTHQECASEP